MFLDQDPVVIARLLLYALIGALLLLKYVHFRIYRSQHSKENLRFKWLHPYGQRERYATVSDSKRSFMTNNNRLLYLIYTLAGLLVLLLVLPNLAQFQ